MKHVEDSNNEVSLSLSSLLILRNDKNPYKLTGLRCFGLLTYLIHHWASPVPGVVDNNKLNVFTVKYKY